MGLVLISQNSAQKTLGSPNSSTQGLQLDDLNVVYEQVDLRTSYSFVRIFGYII